MMRVIHFFNFKPGVDKTKALRMLEEVEKYLESKGCIERRTLKLLDAKVGGKKVESSEYINESLWPGKAEAEAAFEKMPADIRETMREYQDQVDVEKSVRYVEESPK